MINTDDEAEVISLALAEAPSVYEGLPLAAVSPASLGNGFWAVRITYLRRAKDDTKRMRGTTKGGTAHRSHSISTVNKYWRAGLSAGEKPDFKGAINVENGEAKGVDYQVPVFPFSVEVKLNPAVLPSNYLTMLYLLTGTQNDISMAFSYRGQTLTFALGELLFRGADWDIANDDEATFVYDFEASPNTTTLRVGDVPDPVGPGITKAGWDYLWVLTDPTAVSGAMVPQVRGVFVEAIIPIAGEFGVSFGDLIFA